MLNAKENMKACIEGGSPDRYVNNYEAIYLMFHPVVASSPMPAPGDYDVVNSWGVYMSFPENTPGPFPVHTPDKILIKDIENWKDYVKAPSLKFPNEMWETFQQQWEEVPGDLVYKAAFEAPGLFEQSHHFNEITNALMYYMEEPDSMHELIKYLTEFELQMAEDVCTHLKPDAIFHHDDWGTEASTFLRPEMFAEFFVDPYKEIYGYYHDHGVEKVFHHSDSYAATLVPYMIEMGIDVWQGVMASNNVPELVKKYGDQITFMGGIDNKAVEFDGWTEENCKKVVYETLDAVNSTTGFIPCITQGGPGSVYPGVYDALIKYVDQYNMEKFGVDDPSKYRADLQVLF